MEELKYKVAIDTDRISPEELIDPNAIAALVALNEQIEQYKNELKALAEVEKQQGELSEEQKRDLEVTKLALKETQNQYNEIKKSIETVDTAVRTNINTYNGLVAENKALMEAMRNVPLDDTTGELQRLQAQYNANNEKLKEFDASLGNHQRNVGNYKDGLKGVAGSLEGLPGPIGGAVTSFKTFSTVLKANPIGLVIAAVAGLIAMLTKLQPVTDFINKSFAVLTSTLTFFVNKVGGALGIIEKTNVGLGETVRKTAQIADEEVRIRNAKRAQTVEEAKLNNEIARQRLIVADVTKSEEERLAAAQKVQENEEKLLKTRQDLAQKELKNAQDKLDLDKENIALQDEVAQKQADFFQAETDSFNFNRELVAQKGALQNAIAAEQKKNDDEAAARRKKAAEDEKKRLEEQRAAIESLAAARRDIDEKSLQDLEKSRQELLILADTLIGDIDIEDSKGKFALVAELLNQELTSQLIARLEEEGRLVEAAEQKKLFRISELSALFMAEGMTEYEASLAAKEQADLEYLDKLRKAKEAEVELEKNVQQSKTDLIVSAANNALSIGKSLFGESKALAVAQAIIDTYAAANSAAKDTKGGVLVKSLAAAAMIVKGFVNVKKILSTKPSKGGVSTGGTSASAAMSTMAVTPAGTLVNQGMGGGNIARQVAEDFAPIGSRDRGVVVQANVDRRGLAIAVREGERSIRTQQFDFR